MQTPQRTDSPAIRLALATFAILVLELAMIRWLGTQIRIAAYFANLVLLAAFLGMGLGVGLGRARPQLVHWALPTLALVSIVLAAAPLLGLTDLPFPDPALAIWGDNGALTWLRFIRSALVVTACFWAIAGVFLLLGTLVGQLFDRMPALEAYRADLIGSLAGVVAMAIAAALSSPPPVWIALGALPMLWLVRDRKGLVATVIAVAAAGYSIQDARFSPYNRLDITPGVEAAYGAPADGAKEWMLAANRDYHQRLLYLRESAGEAPFRKFVRRVYEAPFALSDGPGRSALVVGAGTGNDVAAALRRGFDRVVSIDIDPMILRTGAERHPEHPYADPRVQRVNNDARAYFGRRSNTEKFDVVCYGLLDSHAMFSSMSSLRLDNFVYTREGLSEAWSRVKDDGILSVSFSLAAGDWMYWRMLNLVRSATGVEPIVIPHHYDVGATFLAGRHLTIDRVNAYMPGAITENGTGGAVAIPTDDWPFLYLRPGAVPWTYITVFGLVALTAWLAVRRVFGASIFSRGRFDAQMFLLGAAFLLLETRAVTQLSLLFGSTWVVNTSVFGGVLAMVIAANALARRLTDYKPGLWYVLLAASIVGIYLMPWQALFGMDLAVRGVVAGLAVAVPIFFAGVIFSSELRARADAAAALGCNLCGAVVGGLLENLSMFAGLKAVVLLALVLYLGSAVVALRTGAAARSATAA